MSKKGGKGKKKGGGIINKTILNKILKKFLYNIYYKIY